MRWPLHIRFWHWLHSEVIGPLAWRYARPPGPTRGIAERINRRRLLWRLNDWAADHWIKWWMAETLRRTEQ